MKIENQEEWMICSLDLSFEVSTHGRVRNINTKTIWELFCRGKYYTVKGKLVHRMIAATFIPNPEGKLTVNHIDGNKLNNHVSNLEWATYSENNLHTVRVLKKKPDKKWSKDARERNKGKRKGIAPIQVLRPIIGIDKLNEKHYFPSVREASKHFKILESSISNCLHGRCKTSGGLQWIFQDKSAHWSRQKD